MKKKKIVGANMKVLYNIEKIRELVDDLFWEYDRMSSSGQETLDKLAKILDLPIEEDMGTLLEDMSDEDINRIINGSV